MKIIGKVITEFDNLTPILGNAKGFYIGKFISFHRGVENLRTGLETVYRTWKTKKTF